VQRQGDDKLIMPGNITFATDSANIAPSFYTR
jgi:outer membrane protein OmpA-like peptidoglycan-associated protein